MAATCNDFSAAAASRPRPARHRAGHAVPAGTGLSRRAFLARGSGLALSVFGGSLLSRMAFEEGIARAAAAPPRRCSSRSSCPAGSTRCRCWRRSATRATPSSGPTLKLARRTRRRFTEDTRLQWHPNAAPLRDLHLAGKVSVMPAIGYDDANQSHFTSRHYWEVGELNPFGRIGWLGPLPRQARRRRQPAAGALARLEPGARAGGLERAGRGGLRPRVLLALRARRLGRRASAQADRRARGAGQARHLRPGAQERPPRRRQTVGLRGQLAPASRAPRRRGRRRSPTRAPTASPAASRSLAEMLDMGLPMQVVALDANGGYDTHDNQNGDAPRRHRAASRSRWPPSRPTSRRAASPTGC